ncbi:MAG TPA: hypothetical protein VFL79_11845, partial [Terriglobia bacterium]|nr:hypothetical protein [Terriglobia bacterium]
MKRRVCILTLTMAFLWGMPGLAQLTGTRFNIPFNFQVGQYQLPAGEYRISAVSDKALLISRLDGTAGIVAMTSTPLENPTKSGHAQLAFASYGEKHFLSQAWLNREFGRELPKSAQEAEYARIAQH